LDSIIREAISQGRLLEFYYDGLRRVVEPYVYGAYKGRLQLLCYQIQGESASGKLPDWRRVNVAEISGLRLLEESFGGPRPVRGGAPSRFDFILRTNRNGAPWLTTVYLVACAGKKRPGAVAAKDLYLSPWFLAARAHVEAERGHWFIFSSEYGLVSPDAVVAPYQKPPRSIPREERRLLSDKVFDALRPRLAPGARVIFLAGEAMLEFLEPKLKTLGYSPEAPLRGLRIGEQLRWFARKRQEGQGELLLSHAHG
jgi:hypothetical protein